MAPIKTAVHIGLEPFMETSSMNGRALDDYDYLIKSREEMFDQLVGARR